LSGYISKTSSGKIQRQACRKAFLDGSLDSIAVWTLASASVQQETTAQNEVEFQLVQIWQLVLGIRSISTNDNFFELGGDSLKAAVVVAEVEKMFSQAIPLGSLAEATTIEQLACLLREPNKKENSRSLVPIKPNGRKRPFFYIHGLEGQGWNSSLAHYLHPERPFYGLQAVGLDGEQAPYTRIEEMVAYYIQEIQTVQPEGPYLLGGLCIGGNIAFEMAQELRKCGQQILLVVMADSPNPFWTEEERVELSNWLSCQKYNRRKELINSGFSLKQIENIFRVQDANIQLIASHIPQVYSGRVVYFSALEKIKFQDEVTMQRVRYRYDPMQPNGWNSWVTGGIEPHKVPGSHMTFFKEPHVRVLAEKLNACLEEVDGVLLSERR